MNGQRLRCAPSATVAANRQAQARLAATRTRVWCFIRHTLLSTDRNKRSPRASQARFAAPIFRVTESNTNLRGRQPRGFHRRARSQPGECARTLPSVRNAHPDSRLRRRARRRARASLPRPLPLAARRATPSGRRSSMGRPSTPAAATISRKARAGGLGRERRRFRHDEHRMHHAAVGPRDPHGDRQRPPCQLGIADSRPPRACLSAAGRARGRHARCSRASR